MNFVRESIFASALRSFCTSVAVILGLAIGIGIVSIAIGILVGPQLVPPKAEPIILPDAQGDRSLLSGQTPAVLQINFHGIIGMGDLTTEKIQNILLDSREDLLKGDRVKAILLHMNTPGGTTVDADGIYRALLSYKQKYNIPIYAYVDGYCASGGMYIACTADKIFASPSSVIGSVGVILGPIFNVSDLMKTVGVSSLTLSEGKDKDALDPFRPWRPGEDEELKVIIASLYDRFVSIVAAARPQLTKEKLVNDYGAHVFVAEDAQKLGYIDVSGASYIQALQELTAAAQISEGEKYQVVRLIPHHPFFASVADSLSPQRIFEKMGLGSPMYSELGGKLLYLYQPGKM